MFEFKNENENEEERKAWFKDPNNKKYIISHFDLLEQQDGFINSGAKTKLEKYQANKDDGLLAFDAINFGNELESELINRDRIMHDRNADVQIYSNKEKSDDIKWTVIEGLIGLGAMALGPLGPLVAGAGGLVAGMSIMGIEINRAVNADTEEQRNVHYTGAILAGILTPLGMLGGASSAVAAETASLEEALPSILEVSENPYLRSTLEDVEGIEVPIEETVPEAPIINEAVPETLAGDVNNIPDNLKLSGDSLARGGRYPIFQDKNTGLHLNTRGGQFIKLDGEQTFIEVTPTGDDGEYAAVGDANVKFTRQTDGSFEVKVGQAVTKYPNLGRVNNELPPEIEELAQPKASFGDKPPLLQKKGYHHGLYKSSNGDLFVSADEGKSFIPVREEPGGGNLNQFRVKGQHDLVNRFVREEDGSFRFEQPRNPGAGGPIEEVELANMGRRGQVNNKLPEDVELAERKPEEWPPRQRPRNSMIRSRDKAGLYRNDEMHSEAFYYISRDNGQSFIEVIPTNDPDEFLMFENKNVKFTRQADGSFDAELVDATENEIASYHHIVPDVQEKLASLNWPDEKMEELNNILSSKPEPVKNQFSQLFRRTPEANKNDFAEIWMKENAEGRGGKGKFMSDWKRLLSENSSTGPLPEDKIDAFRTEYGAPSTPVETPTETPSEQPKPTSETPKIPKDISQQIEKIDLTEAEKETLLKNLNSLPAEDLKKFSEVFRLTKAEYKNDLLFTWSIAKEEQRNDLLNAWLSQDRSRLPFDIEEAFTTQEVNLSAREARKVQDFLKTLENQNISTNRASQLAEEYLTRNYPHAFPAGGAAIRIANVAGKAVLFLGSAAVLTGLGLLGYAIYNAATAPGDSHKAIISRDSETRATVYGSFPNNLVENDKHVRDSNNKIVGTVDSLGNIISPNNDIIKPNGEIIGRYDSNVNIADSNGNIRSPNGEILAENVGFFHESYDKYTYSATGEEVYFKDNSLYNAQTHEVVANDIYIGDDGSLEDYNRNRVGNRETGIVSVPTTVPRYRHVESGNFVYVQNNALYNAEDDNLVAAKINTPPRWELKFSAGTDGKFYGRWYYYPTDNRDGYFVDKPGSTRPETLSPKQTEVKDLLKQFREGTV